MVIGLASVPNPERVCCDAILCATDDAHSVRSNSLGAWQAKHCVKVVCPSICRLANFLEGDIFQPRRRRVNHVVFAACAV